MTVALVAVGAAFGAILLLLLIQWIVRRSYGDPDERVTAVVRELEARIAELHRLAGSNEGLQGEISRLEDALDAAKRRIYTHLTPYQRVSSLISRVTVSAGPGRARW